MKKVFFIGLLLLLLPCGCSDSGQRSIIKIPTSEIVQTEIKDYYKNALPEICMLLCGQQDCDINDAINIDGITYKRIIDEKYTTKEKPENEFEKYFTEKLIRDYFNNSLTCNNAYTEQEKIVFVNNISNITYDEFDFDEEFYQNYKTKTNIIDLHTIPDGIKNVIHFRFEVLMINGAWRISKVDFEILDPHAYMSVEAVAKPVIYLYPETVTNVTVKLDLNGTLGCTYPKYPKDGWQVTAYPGGKLSVGGEEYNYLFWEGELNTVFTFDQGFCVKGEDTAAFLKKALSEMGLIPREYNDFIVYWLPQMEENAYNLISFVGVDYTDNAKLEITPTPDSILRVFMIFKSLENPVEIAPQSFDKFERNGFTVVEWGGGEID